jgi:hypothetical protein
MAGVFKAVDSVDFFVQSRDITTALLNITATATSTQNSADQVNTLHKGVVLFLNVVSVAATATLALNVQGKDPVSGSYVTIGRVSLDASATNATGPNMVQVYPGISAVASLGGQNGGLNAVLPATWRVQASITATASQGGAGVSFSVSQSRIL